jgi:hypothetical protein
MAHFARAFAMECGDINLLDRIGGRNLIASQLNIPSETALCYFSVPLSRTGRNLMANGHINPLSNHKQFARNTQQGLASKALAGTMREIALSLGRPRTRLVTDR